MKIRAIENNVCQRRDTNGYIFLNINTNIRFFHIYWHNLCNENLQKPTMHQNNLELNVSSRVRRPKHTVYNGVVTLTGRNEALKTNTLIYFPEELFRY
jgi:hypothetical protein